jgi:hypothetical protein
MLQSLNTFIGSTVLALAIVFGAMYLALGGWHHVANQLTASHVETNAPSPQ